MSLSTMAARVATAALFITTATAGTQLSASPELLEAAKSGDMAIVQAELAAGADINFTLPNKNPKYGYLVSTPLEEAATNNHVQILELLLAKGAVVRADKWRGLYAATEAGRRGNTEVLALLLAANKAPADKLNYLFGPALISAAGNNRQESAKLLLRQGVSPNWHTPGDHYQQPAILVASRTGLQDMFKILLDAGADPTPYPAILTDHATQGDAAMVQYLLSLGMDPNEDSDHGLPLPMAACIATFSNPEHRVKINDTVAILLEAGADVNETARGRSPLFCAEEDYNEPLIAMLKARDARSFESLGRKLKRAGIGALFWLGDH